jgi:hypothetical protein
LCTAMHGEGYNYVCFDTRDISIYTDVSECLCLSETPTNAFVFFKIMPFCNSMPSNYQIVDKQIIFAVDIVRTSVIDFRDPSVQSFVYKEDDTDLGYDPILKYFWRGVASRLNVSGVSIEHPFDGCILHRHSVSIWKGNALNKIKILNKIPI